MSEIPSLVIGALCVMLAASAISSLKDSIIQREKERRQALIAETALVATEQALDGWKAAMMTVARAVEAGECRLSPPNATAATGKADQTDLHPASPRPAIRPPWLTLPKPSIQPPWQPE